MTPLVVFSHGEWGHVILGNFVGNWSLQINSVVVKISLLLRVNPEFMGQHGGQQLHSMVLNGCYLLVVTNIADRAYTPIQVI